MIHERQIDFCLCMRRYCNIHIEMSSCFSGFQKQYHLVCMARLTPRYILCLHISKSCLAPAHVYLHYTLSHLWSQYPHLSYEGNTEIFFLEPYNQIEQGERARVHKKTEGQDIPYQFKDYQKSEILTDHLNMGGKRPDGNGSSDSQNRSNRWWSNVIEILYAHERKRRFCICQSKFPSVASW